MRRHKLRRTLTSIGVHSYPKFYTLFWVKASLSHEHDADGICLTFLSAIKRQDLPIASTHIDRFNRCVINIEYLRDGHTCIADRILTRSLITMVGYYMAHFVGEDGSLLVLINCDIQ